MAKCDICGKGAQFGNNVSHSNVKRIKCKVNGGNKRMHVCTRCMRSGLVERA